MSTQYDGRTIAAPARKPSERELVLRQVLRLHAQGRTPDDIAMLIGMNPADVRVLIFGLDEPGVVA